MAIVEAASCGLQVVTTRVGGIPEVLPMSLTILTEPTIESVHAGLMLAIQRQLHKRAAHAIGHSAVDTPRQSNGASSSHPRRKAKRKKPPLSADNAGLLCPFECNEIVRNLYNWANVAERTEHVYQHVLKQSDPPFGEKLRLYGVACGSFMVVVAAMYWFLRFLDWLFPARLIDAARDYPRPPTSSTAFQRKAQRPVRSSS